MNFIKLVKSKWFKVYLVIGLIVYIIPFMFGLTGFVRGYLEQKTIFSDYIDNIVQVYINGDKDIAMCVNGNTRGKEDIEYWIYIPYRDYEYTNKKFHHDRITDFSGIEHSLMKIISCNEMPWVEKGFNQYSLPIQYVDELPEPKDRLSTEMFDINQIKVNESTLFVVQKSNKSQLALIRFIDGSKKIGVLFRMSNIHYPNQINPLWWLLYIPAFLLDVLLWPIYLFLILSTPINR